MVRLGAVATVAAALAPEFLCCAAGRAGRSRSRRAAAYLPSGHGCRLPAETPAFGDQTLLCLFSPVVSAVVGTHRMLRSMASARGAGRRLSSDDWIQAGFELLADTGPNSLRVDRLCAKLSVTKGSFYWHFTDMAAYRDAIADAWGSLQDERRRPFENMPDVDPRERLSLMMETLVAPQHWELERAMRAWALTDEAVLTSVQRSDSRILHAVRQAFLDYGFEPEEAELRSTALFAMGVGFLDAANSAGDAPVELRERVLDFILRR